MALTPQRVNKVMDFIETQIDRVNNSKALFTINEGELLPFVLEALEAELDAEAFKRAAKRASPINILPKIIDKLSTLYAKEVTREEETESESNQDIVDWYVKTLGMDPKMICSQKQFNVSKYTALEPYIDRDSETDFDVPKLRVLPAHQFLVYSDDKVDPTRTTVFIKILGQFIKETGVEDSKGIRIQKTVTVYMLYDKDNVVAIDSDREVRTDFMVGNEEGENPFGVIPFIYINASEFSLIPNPDTDTLPMSVLIPLLLTDLNYATQFMSHSIVYAIDADINDLSGNPDAVWHIKSELREDGSEAKATIGTIKPEVDIDKVLKLVETELRMWLDTKSIKAASIGNLEIENAASGIAKMIDESDTTEARQEQETLYQDVEKRLWKLIGIMHDVWLENGDNLEEKRRVIDALKVNTTFEDQEVVVDTEKKIREVKMKLDTGLTSKRRAVREANPELDETELDELMAEIEEDESKAFNIQIPQMEMEDGNVATSSTDNNTDSST